MSLLALLQTELIKLRRSLIVLLLVSVPAMLLLMLTVMLITGKAASDWQRFAMTGSAFWAFFLLPMSATAVTALMAQIEHGAGAWSNVLALPQPRVLVFAAKALLAILLISVLSGLVWLAIISSGLIGSWLTPEHALSGGLPTADLGGRLGKMGVAGLLMLSLQFTVAMAARSFAVPVVLGIGGTFVAVVATSSRYGLYFPWLLPTNILATDPAKAEQALLTGALGGVLVLLFGVLWLGRREFD